MLDLSYKAKVRIYFPKKLSLKQTVTITTKQFHYLINVMRRKKDETLLLFNGVDLIVIHTAHGHSEKVIKTLCFNMLEEIE